MLQKIADAGARDLPALELVEKDTAKELLSTLNIAELTKTAVFGAVNPRRAVLGLPPLTALEATTSLKDGLASASGDSPPIRMPKAQATTGLAPLKDTLANARSPAFADSW